MFKTETGLSIGLPALRYWYVGKTSNLGRTLEYVVTITRLRIVLYNLSYCYPKYRKGYYADKPIESVWSTFSHIKPVWFDLQQLLYLEMEELRRRTKPG